MARRKKQTGCRGQSRDYRKQLGGGGGRKLKVPRLKGKNTGYAGCGWQPRGQLVKELKRGKRWRAATGCIIGRLGKRTNEGRVRERGRGKAKKKVRSENLEVTKFGCKKKMPFLRDQKAA